jgi:formate dehydrogenase accessory protein FdhE
VSVWSTRRARALVLAEEAPHAAEILRCYAALTEVEEAIAGRLPLGAWGSAVGAPDGEAPYLRLPRLPPAAAALCFAEFVDAMQGVGTDVMQGEARALAQGGREGRALALTPALRDDANPAQTSFHARAFVEVVATALAARVLPHAGAPGPLHVGSCRVCGAPPLVGTLRDLPGAAGSAGLLCSRCGSEWRVHRLTCAFCGESNAERLSVLATESVSHVRIDECGSCRRYIKTVDLRRRGDAVPLVEDLATVELDLWAKARGLSKGRTNLFGL